MQTFTPVHFKSRASALATALTSSLAFAVLTAAFTASARAAPPIVAPLPKLVAGPMAGPAEMRAITLWLQADAAAQASVDYWPLEDAGARRRSASAPLDAETQFTAHLRLTDLKPGTGYGYQLMLNGKPASKVLTLRTQQLWQWRTDAPDFTVLAGSCNYGNEPVFDRPGKPYGDRHDIFNLMAAQKPDLTLWLGDNLYYREVDFSSAEGMAYRWAHERKQPHLQELLQTGSHAATWDDHDYGPDNSQSSFVHKATALQLQQRYWANPSYGMPGTPGAFTVFSFGDADIFMLDNRWYRDDPKLPDPRRAMLGETQTRWLKNALLHSTARFKLIAAGSQMLHKSRRGESWQDYPAERDDFMKFLADTKVTGVMFLSGDVHRSELTRIERPGLYPLHDLTCSAMTAGVYVDESLRVRENLVPGTVVMGERNFCRIRFEGNRAERRMAISVITVDGKTQWTHLISAADLGAEFKPFVRTVAAPAGQANPGAPQASGTASAASSPKP